MNPEDPPEFAETLLYLFFKDAKIHSASEADN